MSTSAPVAIVTGGSGGLAVGIISALLGDGMDVVITARGVEALERRVGEYEGDGRIEAIVSDAGDPDSVLALATSVIERFGRIDVLVNAAASSNPVGGAIEELDVDVLLRDMSTKVGGYLRYIQAVVPVMKARRKGSIVNIGGLTGRSSDTLSGLRNVAVSHMTKVLSDQLAPNGIAVNALHPGLVRTPHLTELFDTLALERGCDPRDVEAEFLAEIPSGRMLDTDDVGRAVLFLARSAPHEINGQSITVDGGYSRGVYL